MHNRIIKNQYSIKNHIYAALILISSVAFADQERAWTTLNLGDMINTENYEAFPTITKDGLNLYFARGSARKTDGTKVKTWGAVDDWDIYVSTRGNLSDSWSKPKRLPDHINTGGEEHSVSLSPDGHWMYFSSNNLNTLGQMDIFKSYRKDINDPLSWGKPQNLGSMVNTEQFDVCVVYHQEKDSPLVNLYFVSNREGGLGHVDAWRIDYDPIKDSYAEAQHIPIVSSPSLDGHLDPEAGYIWSEREGGIGLGDLWHSARDKNGNWLAPTNLGSSINTKYEEQMPSPFDHGRVIYFPSNRPGGNGNLDIYIAEKNDLAINGN